MSSWQQGGDSVATRRANVEGQIINSLWQYATTLHQGGVYYNN